MAGIEIRDLDAMRVAALRRRGPVAGVGQTFGELYGRLLAAGTPLASSPPLGIFHDPVDRFDPQDADYEVCVPLAGEGGEGGTAGLAGGVVVKDLPAVRAVCARHRGSYATIGPLYRRMMDWIAEHGLRVAGPVREVYLVAPAPGGAAQPQDCLTEVQIPVESA